MRNAGKILIVVATGLSLAACTNSQVASPYPAGGGPTYPAPNPVVTSAPQTSASARPCTADDITVSGGFGTKPSVTIPATCSAPTSLLTKDLQAGTGAQANAGSIVQVDYDLITWSDKVDQQNTFGGQPTTVVVGQNGTGTTQGQSQGSAATTPGLSQGLAGIKQGGRRLVVVPPNLAYGPTGSGAIKSNETLVYVVDAVQVTG